MFQQLIKTYVVVGFFCVSIEALINSQQYTRTTTANIDTNYRNITVISNSSRVGCGLRCARTPQCKYFFFEPASLSCHLLSYDVSAPVLDLNNYLTWEVFAIPSSCPDSGQYTYLPEFNKCIAVYTNMEKSWNDAQAFCQSDGGSLLTMNSFNEFEFFRLSFFETLVQPQFFNVGAKKTGSLYNDFHWVFGSTVGDKLPTSYWFPGMPDNLYGDEFCVASRWDDGFYLNDVTCEWYPGFFICEYLVP